MMLTKSSFAGAAALLLLGAVSQVEAAAPKDIVLDDFNSMTGWKQMDIKGEMGALKEMKSENGVGVFVTSPAPLGSRQDAKWSDGLPMIEAFGDLHKDFGQVVDLDKYHYFIAKIDEKAAASLYLNGHELPIAYTTGVHVVDLRDYNCGCFRGKQHMTMRIQYLNTGNSLKLDYLKLATELTPEETKELIPPGYMLRPDKLTGNPTQGLDEIMERIDRPAQTKVAGDLLCFRDAATGAVIWRMTEQPTSSTVVSDSMQTSFNANGSHLLVHSRTGPQLYDFQKRTWTPCPFAYVSRFSPRDPDILWCVERTRQPSGIRFHKLNIRTGIDEVVGQTDLNLAKISSPVTDLGFASDCDMIAVGFRETNQAFVFDPTKPIGQRVRAITLPMRLKEMGLSPHGKRLFFNRCYWYESWEMNLATGKTTRTTTAGGSHAGGGDGLRLNHYADVTIATPEGITNGTPGDATKILLNYRSGWNSDYGGLLNNALWYFTNGYSGDLAGQAMLANIADPGTVYQVAFQNTSKNDWDNNTVVRSSPDGTKLAWSSDLWGYTAVCMAYTRQPEPPRDLTARRDGAAVVLKWNHPVLLSDSADRAPAELLGYNIYRSNGGSLLPVNAKVVTGDTFRDENPPSGVCRYVVVTEEYSGIEGTSSNEAVVLQPNMKSAPAFIHIEAELCHLTPPARCAFNGYASDWQYVRIRKELESESVGQLSYDLKNAPTGEYTLWARCKSEEAAGKFAATLDGAAVGDVPVSAKSDWKWIRCEKPVELKADVTNRLVLASADDGLCIDKMILTTDAKYVPVGLDDRFSAPPKKLEQFAATDPTTSSVHLAWQKSPEIDLDYYDVYAAEGNECPVNQAHLIVSTRNLETTDWGLKPGTTYTYKVTAVNRRGQASDPASLTTLTQPVAKAVQLTLTVADAKLDPRLKKESRGGVDYVMLPDQGQAHKNDPAANITWDFDLPTSGEYAIWCKYAPADATESALYIGYQLDKLQNGKGVWKMRAPYREMRGPTYRNYKTDLWFSDRMSMSGWPRATDTFKLAAGKHQLTLRLSPKMGEFSHKISEIWITNDESWRPPGWDPQANFTKAKIVRQ